MTEKSEEYCGFFQSRIFRKQVMSLNSCWWMLIFPQRFNWFKEIINFPLHFAESGFFWVELASFKVYYVSMQDLLKYYQSDFTALHFIKNYFLSRHLVWTWFLIDTLKCIASSCNRRWFRYFCWMFCKHTRHDTCQL